MLKHGILGLLNYGDMTGYEIRETFQNSLNFFWQAQSSQIYRELHTLKDHGWITMTTVEQNDKPNKNICSITDDGKVELLKWLCAENSAAEIRLPLLMQVFFLGNRSKEENRRFFEHLADACQKRLSSLSEVDDNIDQYENEYSLKNHGIYWRMTLDFGKRTYQMCIDWANHCIEELEKAE